MLMQRGKRHAGAAVSGTFVKVKTKVYAMCEQTKAHSG